MFHSLVQKRSSAGGQSGSSCGCKSRIRHPCLHMVSSRGRTVPSWACLEMVVEAELDTFRHFPQELRLSFDNEKSTQLTYCASRDC